QDNIYKLMTIDDTPTAAAPQWWTVAGNLQAAQYKIKTFLCPSDDPSQATDVLWNHWTVPSGTNAAAITASYFSSPQYYGKNLGLTNYNGVKGGMGRPGAQTGGNGWDPWEGIFENQSQ